MTKAQIKLYLSRAAEAYALDNCFAAQTDITRAVTGARTFRGWGATSLRRQVTTLYNRIALRCASGQGLLPPSGETARSDELLPPSGTTVSPSRQLDGFGLSIVPKKGEVGPWIGFVLATAGLAVGFGSLYKAWK